MRKLGKRLTSSAVTAVSWSLYWSRFLPSITSSGFSPAKGSGRTVSPGLYPAGAVFLPPSKDGMEPSGLPACSAPTAVRLVPSLAAASADTAARAELEITAAREAASSVVTNFILLYSCLEARSFADQKVVFMVRYTAPRSSPVAPPPDNEEIGRAS